MSNSKYTPPSSAPDEWFPWRDPSDPFVTRLATDKDLMTTRRDTSNDPKREPGPISLQRYASGIIPFGGYPTFLGAPIALNTQDLQAGSVDVALVGFTAEDNPVPGARYAANTMRSLKDWMSYPPGGTDAYNGVDWSELKIIDYGNIACYANQIERSLEEVHAVATEILASNAIPFGIGGTHINSYGFITALAHKYGPGEFVMLHFDAHSDTYLTDMGRMVHNGSLFKVAVEKGLVRGSDLIQVGLRGSGHGQENLKWMRDHQLRFHFQAEINRDGWAVVRDRILEEIKGRKVYLSFDVDAIDPTYAAAVGTQEADGLTSGQVLEILRAVGTQNEIVAADILEYNPLMDDAHQTTGILIERMIRSLLSGIAARKQGIKDPLYMDPLLLNYCMP